MRDQLSARFFIWSGVSYVQIDRYFRWQTVSCGINCLHGFSFG